MSTPLPYLVNNRSFKTIVINNAEKLSNHAQTALRRTMETYAKTCRFIMICNDLSKILDPLKSRCCVFQVALPTKYEIYTNINYIACCENIDLKESDYINILSKCGNSMKKAIWMLEEIRLGIQIKPSTDVIMSHIIYYIMATNANNYIEHIQKIRMEVYELIITNIRGSDIICEILDELIKVYDSDYFLFNVIKIASVAEFNLIQGRRDIMHIDYFITHVIALLVRMKNNPATSKDFPNPEPMEIRDKSKKVIEAPPVDTLGTKSGVNVVSNEKKPVVSRKIASGSKSKTTNVPNAGSKSALTSKKK
jgi:replication factor C subunit 3/5